MIIASILEQPVIEKILAHLGLNPQPPPEGRANEAGQDFAARAASAVEYTLLRAALLPCSQVAPRAVSASHGQHSDQP